MLARITERKCTNKNINTPNHVFAEQWLCLLFLLWWWQSLVQTRVEALMRRRCLVLESGLSCAMVGEEVSE